MNKLIKRITIIAGLTYGLSGCGIMIGAAAIKYANSKKIEARQGCLTSYNQYITKVKNPMSINEYCGGASYLSSKGKQ